MYTENYLISGQLNTKASALLTFASVTGGTSVSELRQEWIGYLTALTLEGTPAISVSDVWISGGTHPTEHTLILRLKLEFASDEDAVKQNPDVQSGLQDGLASLGIYGHLALVVPFDDSYDRSALEKIKIKIKIGGV